MISVTLQHQAICAVSREPVAPSASGQHGSREMLRKFALCGALCGAPLYVGCNRTPEPPALEKSALAAPAPEVSPIPTVSAVNAAVSAMPAPSTGKAALAAPAASAGHSKIKGVIVIALENHDSEEIYTDTVNAPYIHALTEQYARAANFEDELPLEVLSEGHYIWMEAGTQHFSDATFVDDDPPSASVSTGSSKHLVTQIRNAKGLSWMSYQEGMNEESGACPIASSGFYVPKHDPFVFFRDIAGDPPSKNAPYCATHHKPYSALERDLQGELASYVFITPDECHDMHWQRGCPHENPVRTGDRWLEAELPRLIAYAGAHDRVIFLTFDEGGSTNKMPFLAIGSQVKPGYVGLAHYTHSSMLKSVELILGLPPLDTVAHSNDLSDLFKPGMFP